MNHFNATMFIGYVWNYKFLEWGPDVWSSIQPYVDLAFIGSKLRAFALVVILLLVLLYAVYTVWKLLWETIKRYMPFVIVYTICRILEVWILPGLSILRDDVGI